jgi:hypothetical protein
VEKFVLIKEHIGFFARPTNVNKNSGLGGVLTFCHFYNIARTEYRERTNLLGLPIEGQDF